MRLVWVFAQTSSRGLQQMQAVCLKGIIFKKKSKQKPVSQCAVLAWTRRKYMPAYNKYACTLLLWDTSFTYSRDRYVPVYYSSLHSEIIVNRDLHQACQFRSRCQHNNSKNMSLESRHRAAEASERWQLDYFSDPTVFTITWLLQWSNCFHYIGYTLSHLPKLGPPHYYIVY